MYPYRYRNSTLSLVLDNKYNFYYRTLGNDVSLGVVLAVGYRSRMVCGSVSYLEVKIGVGKYGVYVGQSVADYVGDCGVFRLIVFLGI